ncbi:MAG: GIY-YIG nuclease family protein [Gammaproteobacteria bacterium]|nr:GIY-YIG nuclease family protein [Gammaproteobacteria bacterium]MDE0252601.1 GIY-YIG nuclease family protein [Gammaproteobacteria bacterium]MDE0403487.1 GIY-YIG nuclease family protein [Gammaproteobacteria bacterium]
MKEFHIRFFNNRKILHIVDLLTVDLVQIPSVQGAYILGTSGETMLTYPWATSPVFYIGKADNLRQRLKSHKKYTEGAMHDYRDWWWPRYQYGAAFGVSCAWFQSFNKSPAWLEAKLVANFYENFGSIPVANTSWPKEPQHGSKDD